MINPYNISILIYKTHNTLYTHHTMNYVFIKGAQKINFIKTENIFLTKKNTYELYTNKNNIIQFILILDFFLSLDTLELMTAISQFYSHSLFKLLNLFLIQNNLHLRNLELFCDTWT